MENQNVSTVDKVIVIVIFIMCGVSMGLESGKKVIFIFVFLF